MLACRAEPAKVELQGATGDRLVISIRVSRTAESIDVYTSRNDEVIRVPREDGDWLATYVINRDEFLSAAGEPLSEAEFFAVSPGVDEEVSEAGKCGRCVVPVPEPPFTVFPGDSCRLPISARVSLVQVVGRDNAPFAPESSESVWPQERLREAVERVRLKWPGDCVCEPPTVARSERLEVCPIDGDLASVSEPIRTVIRPDGTVVGIGLGHVHEIPPAGPESARRVVPGFRRLYGADFVGPLDDGFATLVASTARSAQTVDIRALSPDLTFESLVLPFDGHVGRNVLRLGGEDVFALGQTTVTGDGFGLVDFPHIVRCTQSGPGVTCDDQVLPVANCDMAELGIDAVVDAVEFENGDRLAVGSPGRFYLRPAGQTEWFCVDGVSLRQAAVNVSDAERGALFVERVRAVGRTIIGCGMIRPQQFEEQVGQLFTFQMPAMRREGGGVRLDGKIEIPIRRATDRFGTCRVLVADPRDGARTFMEFVGQETKMYWLDENGATLGLSSTVNSTTTGFEPFSEVAGRLEELNVSETSTDGLPWSVARNSIGVLYRRAPGQDTRFEPITSVNWGGSARSLASGPNGEVVVFEPDGPPRRIHLRDKSGCAAVEIEPVAIPGFMNESRHYLAVARDSSGADRYVTAFLESGTGIQRVRFVDLATAEIIEVEAPDRRQRISEIVEMAPGEFLVMTTEVENEAETNRVWRLREGVFVELRELEDEIRSITAANGIGWVVARRPETRDGVRLIRIRPGPAGAWIFDDDMFERLNTGPQAALLEKHSRGFMYARAVCPDHVDLMGPALDDGGSQADVRADVLWRIQRKGKACLFSEPPTDDTGLVLCRSPDFEATAPNAPLEIEGPIHIGGSAEEPITVFTGARFHSATVYRKGALDTHLPFSRAVDAADGDGFVVITDDQARRVVVY